MKIKNGKVIKESVECPNLVFGVNMHFDSVMVASESILVGRVREKYYLAEYITEWIGKNSDSAPNREVEVIIVLKGWFMLRFNNVATLECVMEMHWSFGITSILFKRWTPLFESNREILDEITVWVKRHALPPHF